LVIVIGGQRSAINISDLQDGASWATDELKHVRVICSIAGLRQLTSLGLNCGSSPAWG
jgi:hypothetical protein